MINGVWSPGLPGYLDEFYVYSVDLRWNATAFFASFGSSILFYCPQGLWRIFGIFTGQQPSTLSSFVPFELAQDVLRFEPSRVN